MNNAINVKDLPESERPYEKLLTQGPLSLSDAELLAIIIKTGTAKCSAIDISKKLLCGHNCNLLNLYDYSMEDLLKFEGIGRVKAIQLKAIAELSRRINKSRHFQGEKFTTAFSVADYFMEDLRHKKEEQVVCAMFDSKMHLLSHEIIALGSLNCAYIEPRAVLKPAIVNNAPTIILLHNHPSGDSYPSQSDIELTQKMEELLRSAGIKLADHIIIGDNQFFSFKEHNYLE